MGKARLPPNAALHQAQKMLAAGKVDKARSVLAKICRAEPRNVQALGLLGVAEARLGRIDRAVTTAQRVVALIPDDGPSLTNLANLLALSGCHEEAQSYYRRALELTPDDPVVLNNLGRALVLAGRPQEAEGILAQAVKIRPDYAEAHYNLAQALDAACRWDEVIAHYRTALRLKPDLLEAQLELATRLHALGRLQEAEAGFRAAVKRRPESIESHVGLASCLAWQGKLDEALAIHEGLIRDFPNSPEGVVGVADVLEQKGRVDEAWERLRPLIDAGQATGTAAVVFARLCRHVDRCEQAAALGESLLERGSLPEGVRRVLYYALASLYDRRGAYDDAFRHVARANDLTPVRSDGAAEAENIDRLLETFQPATLARLPRAANHTDRPVFIVGMPRSGTTLVEQILAAHPQVAAAGELIFINRLVLSLPERLDGTYPDCLQNLTPEFLDRAAAEYLNQLDEVSADASRVTDKMPHNFWHLGVIALLFPGARVIHCVRDPRDTCLSIYFQNFNVGHSYATDLARLGTYYRGYLRLMAHWRTVLNLPMFEVQYEELVTRQESLTRSLVAFCGLDWDERCLRFHRSERVVSTVSYDQVRQPLYTRSMGRWQHYEQYLGPLIETLGVASPQ